MMTPMIGNLEAGLVRRSSFAIYKDRLNLLSQIDALESVVLPTLRAQSANLSARQTLKEAEARLAELRERLNHLQLD